MKLKTVLTLCMLGGILVTVGLSTVIGMLLGMAVLQGLTSLQAIGVIIAWCALVTFVWLPVIDSTIKLVKNDTKSILGA